MLSFIKASDFSRIREYRTLAGSRASRRRAGFVPKTVLVQMEL